jgi:hypothetical protein
VCITHCITVTAPTAAAITTVAVSGSTLSGSFNVAWNTFGPVTLPYDASEAAVETTLEGLSPTVGQLKVTRTGPDAFMAYSWRIAFLDNLGQQLPFVATWPLLAPATAAAGVTVARTALGTYQHAQTVTTTKAGASAAVSTNTYFRLRYGAKQTGPIEAFDAATGCSPTQREVQTIALTTVDTTNSGGDSVVDSTLQFTLQFTERAAPNTAYTTASIAVVSQDCTAIAALIKSALEALPPVQGTAVTVSVLSATAATKECYWRVTFTGLPGNQQQLTVLAAGGSGPAAVSVLGDDTLTVSTFANGAVSAIKYELELLQSVGTVTVTAAAVGVATLQQCQWTVNFDTNTDAVPALLVAGYRTDTSVTGAWGASAAHAITSDTIAVAAVAAPALGLPSVGLGGTFALSYAGQRTVYLPFDATDTAVQTALEALPSVGLVDVQRYDGNGPVQGAYAWSVTFLTALGNLPALGVDALALTGTSPQLSVSELIPGVAPPFNSGAGSGPLNSDDIVDMSDLSLLVTGLTQAVPYYFRAAAFNTQGYGAAAVAAVPYAVPLLQSASPPLNTTLQVVDRTTIRVSFEPPASTGGGTIDSYRVEYATVPFENEVQEVVLGCTVPQQVQSVTTVAGSTAAEVQIVHARMADSYFLNTVPALAVQTVVCDASGGNFTLTYDGRLTTTEIMWNAGTVAINDALEELLEAGGVPAMTVTVVFPGGVSQACAPGNAGWIVRFDTTAKYNGAVPNLVGNVNHLLGLRIITATTTTPGVAQMSGSFKLTYGGATTTALSYAATSAQVQAALAALPSIGGVSNVAVVDVTVMPGAERAWRVSFTGLLGNIDALQVSTVASVYYYYAYSIQLHVMLA